MPAWKQAEKKKIKALKGIKVTAETELLKEVKMTYVEMVKHDVLKEFNGHILCKMHLFFQHKYVSLVCLESPKL